MKSMGREDKLDCPRRLVVQNLKYTAIVAVPTHYNH